MTTGVTGAGRSTPVAGFKVYPAYLTLLLWRGQAIEDASGRLAASGSAEMGTVWLQSTDDLDAGLLADWLRRVRDLDAA